MDVTDISFIFNRALSKTIERRKLLLVFVVSLLCGLLVVFFKGVASGAGTWMKKSLIFFPFFLCAGVMLSTGIMLIRIYHDEIKQKNVSYLEVLSKSWEIIIGASYFSIPFILCYLLLWMLMGVFLLFEQVPFIGPVFSVILAFGPFLLNLGSVILCIFNVALLFYAAPALALKGLSSVWVSKSIIKKFQCDVFGSILLALIAVIPIAALLGILSIVGLMSDPSLVVVSKPLFSTMRWIFIMIPFVAFLTPAIVFFFNFSAEAHVLSMKKVSEFEREKSLG
jgi:hypothetical protein